MPVDRPYVASNAAQRQRLQALVERLSDEELGRSLGTAWTVSAALAHLAFWDRRALLLLERWEREGVKVSAVDVDSINDAALPLWLAVPPRAAAREAAAAAEALDRKLEALSAEMVQSIVASGSMRPLERWHHRRDHLDEIERAVGA